jgi:hypothetical protein
VPYTQGILTSLSSQYFTADPTVVQNYVSGQMKLGRSLLPVGKVSQIIPTSSRASKTISVLRIGNRRQRMHAPLTLMLVRATTTIHEQG